MTHAHPADGIQDAKAQSKGIRDFASLRPLREAKFREQVIAGTHRITQKRIRAKASV